MLCLISKTEMNRNISERIEVLRELMKREHLAAFIFPSTDPHHSEYVPDRWKGREWISGFNGSAGTAVVTMTDAAVWTDSRYFLAAAEQLKGTGFKLMKLKIQGTPSIAEWIKQNVYSDEAGTAVTEIGVDGRVNSYASVEKLKSELQYFGITVRTNLDPLNEIWKDRPGIPDHPIIVHPLKYTGEDTRSKLSRIRQALHNEYHCDGMLVSALDDIAWILNLRGSDVHCNPVFVAYLIIENNNAVLFVNENKIPEITRQYLQNENIEVRPYDEVGIYLHKDYFAYNIFLDPQETNAYLAGCVNTERVHVVFGNSPVPAMKAVKNDTEIKGYHSAMIKDGIALVKFLMWIKPAVDRGEETEMSIDRKLTGLRAEQPLFKDISFDTIAGYGAHGAIIHYEATPETDIPVEPRGFLLLDSGAQYLDGTTDITRTIPLGPLTEEEKHIYTLVLKGHVQLELAKFPDGASGTQIDALAREIMWREGYNFLHGTGHGVGSYLNVHEGPHQIRMEYMEAPLHAGMTVTDEPGLYLGGKFGVRIENTLLIKEYKETEFGKFLQMEPLTLCPIDMEPVDLGLLLPEEICWINQYHRYVYDKLSPYLSEDEKQWLKGATQKVIF